MTNILIAGASGFLGKYLVHKLESRELSFSTPTRRPVKNSEAEFMDITDLESIESCLRRLKPNCLINLAAINPIRGSSEMDAVNLSGAENLAKACAANSVRLIHMSTDVVHDGVNPPYSESIPPSSKARYGSSKASGEQAISENCNDFAIIRTSLIYSTDTPDRGTAVFIEKLANGEDVKFFTDVIRQPVWVENLVDAIIELADHDFRGIINFAGSESLSRDTFGRSLLEYFKVPGRERVLSVLGAEIAPSMPRDTSLSLDLAMKVLDTRPLGLSEVLSANSIK